MRFRRLSLFLVLCLPFMACSQDVASPSEQLTSFLHAFQAGDTELCARYSQHDHGLGENLQNPKVFAGDEESLVAWQSLLARYNELRQDFSFYVESEEILGDDAELTLVFESIPLHLPLQQALHESRSHLAVHAEPNPRLYLLRAMERSLEFPPEAQKEVIVVHMIFNGEAWELAANNPSLWEHLEAGIMHLHY